MKVLITGAGGLLGSALRAHLPNLQLSAVALTHAELDVTDRDQVTDAIRQHRPDVLINCAGYTRVDDAETHEEAAFRVNALAAGLLADVCARNAIRVVYPSTDYVFDSTRRTACQPEDAPRPINVYGRSKVAGEVATRTASDHVIVRTSWLFGGGGPNFVRTIAARLHDGGGIRVVADQTGRPTYAKDLAHAIGRLLADRAAPGTYHVANSENATWFEFAREIARQLSSAQEITPCTTAEMRRPAKRPGYSVLDTTKTDRLIGPLRSWRPALAEAIQTEDY